MANIVENSQLNERLFGRREFLITVGGLVVSVSALGLIGCGGAGGMGGTASPMVQISGTIGLPTGFTIPAAQLSVIAGLTQTAVKAPASFTAKIAGQSPSLAILQDSAGNGVMLGFLDPTKTNNTIDSHSTAVALIYFMLGGYTVPSANVANILNLISSDPSMAALAQVIATRLAADPHAVQNSDAQIAAALTASYNSIVTPVTAAVLQSTTVEKPFATPAAQLLVQPDGQVSGVDVIQAGTPLNIQITNHFRRRCKVFVYKAGTQPSGGALDTFTKVESFAGPVDLPTVVALGLVEALVDLFQGTAPLTPITIAPIPLTLDSGATRTLYEVVVLGSSANNTDPSFYSDSRYVDQVAMFRATRISLNIQTLLADLVFGIFLEMIGIRQEIAGTVAVEGACDAMAAVADAEWQAALALAQGGLFGQAAVNALKRIASSSLVRQDLATALGPLLSYAQASALKAAEGGLADAAFVLAEKMILGVLGATGVLLGFGDIGAVLYAMGASDAGDVWTADAFIPSFALNPPTSTVTPGSRVTFTVTAPPGITGSIEYDWTQTSTFATFSASDGTVGNAIKTTSAATTVDLVTSPSDQGSITVTVIAYELVSAGQKTEIGQVTAKVTMGSGNTGSTGTVLVTKYQPGSNNQSFSVFAFATFSAVPGASTYAVMIGGNVASTLTAAAIAGGAPVVDLTADSDTSTLVPYSIHDGSTDRFYNLGGTTIGYMAVPFSGTYAPIQYLQAALAATQQQMAQNPVTVVIT